MKYRPEIDGLRAVAVMSVIMCHAGFQYFTGGYIGVDVFFVISGYLITMIVCNDISKNTFTLMNFYERRARRLLPVLFVVVICSLPFALLFLTQDGQKEFAKSIIGVATFTSNFVFWSESGYFETSTVFKPLLHTWSLSVEEQFYLFYPLLLMMIWPLGKRYVLFVLFSLFFFSLLLAEWRGLLDPSAVFYLLPTRIWELAVGAICALYLLEKKIVNVYLAQVLSFIGLLLISFSVFTFTEHTPTPSLYTLIPVLGSALVILFSINGTLVYSILKLSIFVWVGLISYSAYLWHQPILSLLRNYYFTPQLSFRMTVVAIVLTFLLSIITWRLIEQPFRNSERHSQKKTLSGAFCALVILFLVGFSLYNLPQSMTPFIINKKADNLSEAKLITGEKAFLKIGLEQYSKFNNASVVSNPKNSSTKYKILILGDSHTEHLNSFAKTISHQLGYEIHLMYSEGCPALFNYYKVYGIDKEVELQRQLACREQNKIWKQYVSENNQGYTHVVLSARWNWLVGSNVYGERKIRRDAVLPLDINSKRLDRTTNFANAIKDAVEVIDSSGIKTILFSQPPVQMRDLRQARSKKHYFEARPLFENTLERQKAFEKSLEMSNVEKNDSFTYFDVFSFFCNEKTEVCRNLKGSSSLYEDDDHLSEYGASELANWFMSNYSDVLTE